jgi:hypothetical protein
VDEGKFISIKKNGAVRVFSWGTEPGKMPFQCGLLHEKALGRVMQPQPCFDPALSVARVPLEILNSGQLVLLGGLCEGVVQLLSLETEEVIDLCHTPRRHTATVIRADSM